jgi:hypothetical protein
VGGQRVCFNRLTMVSRAGSLSASIDVKPGLYSVGPCHDVPWGHKWVVLKAGQVDSGQIAAFEPGDSYIVSSCSWHHAHLGGLIRLDVNAYPSKALSRRINRVSDPLELVRTATSSMLRPPRYEGGCFPTRGWLNFLEKRRYRFVWSASLAWQPSLPQPLPAFRGPTHWARAGYTFQIIVLRIRREVWRCAGCRGYVWHCCCVFHRWDGRSKTSL